MGADLTNPAISVETERLFLVALAPDHADFLFSMLSDSDHTRYLTLPTPQCLGDVRGMIEGLLSAPGNCLWIIRFKAGGGFVGMCGFLGDSTVPNFVYGIAENQKGNGYAREAAMAAIEAGRRILGTDRVEVNIHSGNVKSLRIADELGFAKTGECRHIYQIGRAHV